MSRHDDRYIYTPEVIEAVVLSTPSHYLDYVELVVDIDRAMHWLSLEFPTSHRILNALIGGWTMGEIAQKAQLTPEAIDEQVYQAFVAMANWLNA